MKRWNQTLAELAGNRGAALKRYAFLLCGDDSQAEDLVQEALARAFGRPLRGPRPGAVEAYVRVIMVNLFIDGVRRCSRWNRAAPSLGAAVQVASDPAEQVTVRDAMLAALRSLPAQQRACVVLRYYEDLPVAAIAAALGLADGTVNRYLSDALAALAARLPQPRQSSREGNQADAD